MECCERMSEPTHLPRWDVQEVSYVHTVKVSGNSLQGVKDIISHVTGFRATRKGGSHSDTIQNVELVGCKRNLAMRWFAWRRVESLRHEKAIVGTRTKDIANLGGIDPRFAMVAAGYPASNSRTRSGNALTLSRTSPGYTIQLLLPAVITYLISTRLIDTVPKDRWPPF